MRMIEEHFHLEVFNSLIGVMAMGFVLTNYFHDIVEKLTANLKKMWGVGAVFLFTLVGGAVNPGLTKTIFFTGTAVLLTTLLVRSIGVAISLIGTDLNFKERLFCIIAYLPKATVQSAKAGIPLQMGVAQGELIQAMSILAVIITAPIGAIGIKLTADKFLEKED
jgi:solute carrier family 9B (sodium/hydrogen exchanger), member 1/2